MSNLTFRFSPNDPRLGRHVNHDPRSRQYDHAERVEGVTLASAKHTRHAPVFDQGNLGSCTGNAGVGATATSPVYDSLPTRGSYTLDEGGAVSLYSAATKADAYPGQYPPDDTGSDGLTVAKVLKQVGEISGYTHAFDVDTALKALVQGPFITGVTWYNSMFNPDSDGRVHPTSSSGVAGGHEFVADELEYITTASGVTDYAKTKVWFTNSWGTSWGVNGRFYMTAADYRGLLADQGDVTVLLPLTAPAPTPTPTPTPTPDPSVLTTILTELQDAVAKLVHYLKGL